jgi:hypothetical protein
MLLLLLILEDNSFASLFRIQSAFSVTIATLIFSANKMIHLCHESIYLIQITIKWKWR